MKAVFNNVSWRFTKVWRRNTIVYERIWKISFLPPLLEPLFYLAAFGIGLSVLVGSINYQGAQVSYSQFIAPALIAISIMYNAFFETTYASFVRMYYQKTYDAMLATPLSLEDVMTGEIAWAATKSVLATLIMIVVISLFGLIQYPAGLLLVPLALLGGLAFAALGLFFTAVTKSIEMFNLPIFLFVTPMFLFSGTFFPLENLPGWAQKAALVLPLTHVVTPARLLSLGLIKPEVLWSCGYLIVFCMVVYPLAIVKMRKRLIK